MHWHTLRNENQIKLKCQRWATMGGAGEAKKKNGRSENKHFAIFLSVNIWWMKVTFNSNGLNNNYTLLLLISFCVKNFFFFFSPENEMIRSKYLITNFLVGIKYQLSISLSSLYCMKIILLANPMWNQLKESLNKGEKNTHTQLNESIKNEFIRWFVPLYKMNSIHICSSINSITGTWHFHWINYGKYAFVCLWKTYSNFTFCWIKNFLCTTKKIFRLIFNEFVCFYFVFFFWERIRLHSFNIQLDGIDCCCFFLNNVWKLAHKFSEYEAWNSILFYSLFEWMNSNW